MLTFNVIDNSAEREFWGGGIYIGGGSYTSPVAPEITNNVIEENVADPAAGRGGRPKRYFEVSAVGVKALSESRDALLTLWDGVENILEKS